jgi:hypothetical protein
MNMRTSGALLVSLALGSLALGAGPASAQPDVAHSGMGQGEASITTETGISLALDSVPGTSAARVQAMGRAVQTRMTTLRGCYHSVVASRPIVAGIIRMQITLAEGTGAPTITVTEDGVHDAEMLTCARAALLALPTAGLQRPSSVVAVLTLANSASEGSAIAARRATEADHVDVTREGDRPTASMEMTDVRFVIRGVPGSSDELLAEGFRVVRSQIAGLLDCRRRASRRRRSPAGTVVLTVTMTAGQPLAVHMDRTTVAAGAEAGTCVAERLARAPRTPATGPGTFELELTFAP